MPRIAPHRSRCKPPFFHPVPVRRRSDGWTEFLQCAFLAELYLSGSVSFAAQRVGMSRMSAYRLRSRANATSFGWAWDCVLTPPAFGPMPAPKPDYRKVTNPMLLEHVETGLVRPMVYRGRLKAIDRKPDNSALLRLLRRMDAVDRRVRARSELG